MSKKALAKKREREKNPFPFLQLPNEVRNMVYDCLFISPEHYIGRNMTSYIGFLKSFYVYRNVSFIRTCRQIYQETESMFFACNGFVFHRSSLLQRFLEGIGPKRRRMLTKLRFNWEMGDPYPALRFVRSCTNLRSLEINYIAWDLNPDHGVIPRGWSLFGYKSYWVFPLLRAMDIFFNDYEEYNWGEAVLVRKGSRHEMWGPVDDRPQPMNRLEIALRLIRREVKYLRQRYESCHFKNTRSY
jgi:hypothetical protein